MLNVHFVGGDILIERERSFMSLFSWLNKHTDLREWHNLRTLPPFELQGLSLNPADNPNP